MPRGVPPIIVPPSGWDRHPQIFSHDQELPEFRSDELLIEDYTRVEYASRLLGRTKADLH